MAKGRYDDGGKEVEKGASVKTRRDGSQGSSRGIRRPSVEKKLDGMEKKRRRARRRMLDG